MSHIMSHQVASHR